MPVRPWRTAKSTQLTKAYYMISIQYKVDALLDRIKQAIATDQLQLPSLPDVALNVKTACESDNTTAQDIADVITQDPAMTARLLQVANSSLYPSQHRVDTVSAAITKLGLKMVVNLVISLSMKQLYHTHNDVIAERFRELWLASTKTAALARLLAQNIDHLNTEQAMLAGLIHNIGALPIILMAEDDDDLFDNPDALLKVTQAMQGTVGAYIFRKWRFPEVMAEVASECYDFQRQHGGPADYTDVIQVALIEGSIYTGLACPDDWSAVAAFAQLGVDTSDHVLDIEENKLIFEETSSLFK